MPRDPRVAAVEDNLLDFVAALASLPLFTSDGHDDVVTYHCEVAFPMFNALSAARFPAAVTERRTREVIAPFLDRGLPFMWWLTPSTTSPGLERVLVEAGMSVEETPGMHRPLTSDGEPLPVAPGIEVRVCGPGDQEQMMGAMLAGFGFPEHLYQPMRELMGLFAPDRLTHVMALVGGDAVAAGSVWLTGETAGLYNIATVGAHRGRGVGYAVTAALLDVARQRGCTQAVLHATAMGKPVYRRLGFVEVCPTPQYVWGEA
ncbi:MAG TPA: GNAT family N-acetyltransferase [Pedococcus sp.]|jgi:GNAT superfamily N-acetyltransferase